LILLATLTRLRLAALLSRLLAALAGLLTGLLLTTAALLATLTATTLVLLVGPLLFVWHHFTPCMAARRDTNKSGDAYVPVTMAFSPPSVAYRTDARRAAESAACAGCYGRSFLSEWR
jgi:hypothetical protein